MGNIGKITAGAGVIALAAVLGIFGYERFAHPPMDASIPATAPNNQAFVNPAASTVPLNANQMPQQSVPILNQQVTTAQPGVQLRSQQATYAPEPFGTEQTTTTTTSNKTAYVAPSTAVHRAYVYHRVRREKPGNVHVARALKHTVAFTVKLPGRLRF
jgi:hypothetical protein